MDINIAWWNTSVSPPVVRKKDKLKKNKGKNVVDKKRSGYFESVVLHLIRQNEVDILGLCEVDLIDIGKIDASLSAGGLNSYKVVPLYKQDGMRVNDYCLVYNSEKIEYKSMRHLEYWDEVDAYYKAGVLVRVVIEGDEFSIFLSHWQSKRNLHKEHRDLLGGYLRLAVNAVFSEFDGADPNIILLGDFNDEPFESSVTHHLKSSRDKSLVKDKRRVLYNPFWRVLGSHTPYDAGDSERWDRIGGTCIYKSAKEMTFWKTFDQILFSCAFVDGQKWHLVESCTKVCSELLGEKIYKNWASVSDHLPVFSKIRS